MKGKLIIVDPSLKDEKGHHYALTKAVCDGALKNNLEVMIFANKYISLLPDIKKTEIIPVFSSTTYDPFIKKSVKKRSPFYVKIGSLLSPKILSRLKKYKKVFISLLKGDVFLAPVGSRAVLPLHEELLLAIKEHQLNSSDHILIHTADGDIYRGLLQLSVKPNFDKLPYFHVNTPYDDKVMPHYNKGITPKRVVDYLNLMGKIEKRVFLYAENKLLSDYLSNTWDVKVCPLEIPPTEYPQIENNKSGLNVVYVGAAREEKGFLLIPDVVKIISCSDEKKNIKFTLQCSPQIIGYLPVISKALARLREFSSELVSLIERQQSMNEYFSTIQNADVILLCYDKNRYGVRGSGIAVESVTFGKIIIATPETFPAYVGGDAAILASNAKEVAKAIISIAQDKEPYLKRAKARQEKYLKENSSTEYVKSMATRVLKSATPLTKEVIAQQKRNDYHSEKIFTSDDDIDSILISFLQGNGDNASLRKLIRG